MPQAGAPVAGGMMYAAGGLPGAGAFQMTPGDVWRIIRANLWLIIILVMVCGAGGYLAHRVWAAYWPSYTATGLLEIKMEITKDAVNERVSEVSDTRLVTLARTQQQRLTFPALFSEVLAKAGPMRETDWFKQFKGNTQDAKDDLEKHFRVAPFPDSALLMVRMTCRNPRDAKIIVDEVVTEHIQLQKQAAQTQLDNRTKGLSQLKDRYDAEIRDISGLIKTTQIQLAEKGAGVEGMFSTTETELRALVEGRIKISSEAADAEGQYQRAKQQFESGQTPPEVQKAIDSTPLVLALGRELAGYQIARDMKRDLYGKEHKDVLSATNLADLTEKMLSERRNELRVNFSTLLLSQLEGVAKGKKDELASLEKSIAVLKNVHVEFSRELAKMNLDKEKQKDLNERRQQTANVLSTISATLTPDNQVRIEWGGPAEIPEIMSWPKVWFMVPAGVMLGLMLGLGIAFLREMMDDTVRSPRDVSRVGQMNLLGIIADEDDDPAVANAKLPIFDAPHSMTAEQFRQVRTRLQHSVALETTRSIMVTGPSPLGGKTTVAANLAAGLALNGRKILLVDANFRRPELHRLFGFGNEKGFSDVLNTTSGLGDCLHATRIPNLSVLTSGAKPPNATELFESQLLADFIERALEEFDHVIFDTGPFLVVSESVAMAPRVDGVVTVVRAHEESRGTLQRMRDGLRQVKAEHIGVVLNAVRAQGGGYYGRNIKTYYTYSNGE
ncbi:MAG: polysaccharide biosynthesis tyrosine autokinase [Planctomycetota bacterium]|nr:polysaccharide biosynthesis tyrosine autokinase [Planctomycetota bacterium]